MNLREPSQSFEAARRQHLIDATIEALADVGFKAASLSQIARRADVSTGLFAHYFGDKDGLLEATLRFMAARLVRATRERLRAAKSPRARLYAVPDSALADQEFERRTSAVWLAFWGQITHSTRYQRIQILYQRRMVSNLRHDLRALVPADCVEPYATIIASMIDGVWIRSHATPTQTDGAQARAIVRALIDGLLIGASDRSSAGHVPLGIAFPSDPSRPTSQSRVKTQTTSAAAETAIAKVVENAHRGLDIWRGMTALERANVLGRCGDALRIEADDLARLDALCTGRAIRQTREFSLPRARHALASAAVLASRPVSERLELGPGLFEHRRCEPFGVVAGFGHWSAPLLDVCCQSAAALASGNAMIFLPSAEAPLSACRIAEIFHQAGLPAGLFTVLEGNPEMTDPLLFRSDAVACDPFDEFAVKAATIVFDGASVPAAVTAILKGYRRWAHVPDFSENRIFVQRTGLAAFRARLVAQAKRMRGGDPLAPDTPFGGHAASTCLRKVTALVDQAIDAGAIRLLGSGTNCDHDDVSSAPPTILDECHVDMPLIRQRHFAPVITLIAFDDDDDIVRLIANDKTGVAVGIFDADVGHAQRVVNRLHTHFCCINDFAVLADEGDGVWASPVEFRTALTRSKRIFCRRAAAEVD